MAPTLVPNSYSSTVLRHHPSAFRNRLPCVVRCYVSRAYSVARGGWAARRTGGAWAGRLLAVPLLGGKKEKMRQKQRKRAKEGGDNTFILVVLGAVDAERLEGVLDEVGLVHHVHHVLQHARLHTVVDRPSRQRTYAVQLIYIRVNNN